MPWPLAVMPRGVAAAVPGSVAALAALAALAAPGGGGKRCQGARALGRAPEAELLGDPKLPGALEGLLSPRLFIQGALPPPDGALPFLLLEVAASARHDRLDEMQLAPISPDGKGEAQRVEAREALRRVGWWCEGAV